MAHGIHTSPLHTLYPLLIKSKSVPQIGIFNRLTKCPDGVWDYAEYVNILAVLRCIRAPQLKQKMLEFSNDQDWL